MLDVVALLRGKNPESPPEDMAAIFPVEAADKVAKRLCLQCGKAVPQEDRYSRGLDGPHYLQTNQRINEDKTGTLEFELVAAGLLAPPDPGGRRKIHDSTTLDQFIATRDQSPESLKKKAAALANHPDAKNPKRITKKTEKKL